MKHLKGFQSYINESKTQSISERNMVALGPTLASSSYTHLKMGDAPANDMVNKPLLDDIEKAAIAAKVHVLVTAANSDHNIHRDFSRHSSGLAVDLARIGDESVSFDKLEGSNGATQSNPNTNPRFKEAGNRLVDALIALGYKIMTQDPALKQKYGTNVVSGEGQAGDRAIIWQYDSKNAGNHYNHVHVSNRADNAVSGSIAVTPSASTSSLASNQGLPSKIRTSGATQSADGKYDDEYNDPKPTVGTSFLSGLVKTANLGAKSQPDVGELGLSRAAKYIS
jgi:hypothetical protein